MPVRSMKGWRTAIKESCSFPVHVPMSLTVPPLTVPPPVEPGAQAAAPRAAITIKMRLRLNQLTRIFKSPSGCQVDDFPVLDVHSMFLLQFGKSGIRAN
jgi:hypothetical protein